MLDPRALTPLLRVLAACLHLLMAGLLALAAVRSLIAPDPDVAAAVAAVVTGAIYAIGPASRRVLDTRRARAYWLAALVVAWLVLLGLTPEGIWVAFPIFFIQLHLLPGRWGVGAVVVTTALAIGGFGWHQHTLNAGTILGPVLGAAFAIATARGYQALYSESEQRRQLIDELLAARDDLAIAERTAGTLAERDRLAREIHDTVAQGLSSIQLLLHAAERALPEQPEVAAGHVRQARTTAGDNLAEARRFVHELSPPDLAEGSLASALERLCSSTAATTDGLDARFELTGTPAELSTQYQVGLLRMAQSALANTARHAGAGRVDVTLGYTARTVTMDIVDDGVGFDDSAAGEDTDSEGDERRGFGLQSMRERAAALGGSLTVRSTPGTGTTIAVSVPLPAQHRSQ